MHVKSYFFFLLLICATSSISSNPYLTSENDTLSLVDETVDAYNGKFVHLDTDIEINTFHPLEVNRYYDGGHHFDSEVGYGVGLSFPVMLKFNGNEKQNILVEQRIGFEVVCTVIPDKQDKKDKKKKAYYRGTVDPNFFKYGYTNCAEALLRGEPSLLALQIEGDDNQFVVTLGDGTRRYYSFFLYNLPERWYRIVREDFPDGCHRHYSYIGEQSNLIKQVWTTNPANTLIFNCINFSHNHENYVRIDASNGQQVFYHLKVKKGEAKNQSLTSYSTVKFYKEILTKVTANHLPTCEYDSLSRSHYTCTLFSNNKISLPDGRFIKVDYDDYERVKKLWTSQLDIPLYEFHYHNDHTTVTDAKGGFQRFFYSNRHLIRQEEPHRHQHFSWDGMGQLRKQVLSDTNNVPVIEREYDYDAFGNITAAKMIGCIIISGSKDTYSTRYHYSQDGKNLLVCEEHPDGYAIGYGYVPNTSLMNLKRVVSNNQIVEREFYHNDENGMRTVTVIDDGSGLALEDFSNVTYRKIIQVFPQLNPALPGITLPWVIQESYQDPLTGAIYPLKKIERTYCRGDLLEEEKVYDAEGKYCYSLRYEYNDRRQLISETDPLGFKTIYAYDDNGNKIYEEKVGSGRKVVYVYDKANHLITEVENADGKILTTAHTYDSVGNRKDTTDPFSQKTTFEYDLAGREKISTDPLGYKVIKSYDVQGNVISQIDQDGHLTTTLYNLYNKPLEIHYPDGTEKRFIYNLHGHLIYEKERDGLENFYDVDYKGRIKSTKTYSNGVLLKTIQKVYKGPNLILEIDAMENQTSHTYDPAGRLIATQQGEKITRFEYDALGRLSKTITPERTEVKEYDYLDQVIEERIEHLGNVFQKTVYAYDIYGNCISQKHYSNADAFAETKTSYNSKNLPILMIDACGNSTTIDYHYSDHLIKEITDPLGRKKLEVYDPLSRLKEVFVVSSFGIQAHYTLDYDGRGNQVLRQEDVICNSQVFGTFTITTAYNSMGQKISEIEQDKKATRYSYLLGRLHTLTNPDQVVLTHSYDPLGRLSKLVSSDGTIDYQYTYDLNDNLLTAEDLIYQTVSKRSYDRFNRQIFEKQATGFEISYDYDTLDRLKKVTFLDTEIAYEYNPLSLVSVKRYRNGNLLYQYHQTADWLGKISSCQLPNIALSYSWDPMGRCLTIDSSHYKQNATYNPVGNLTHLSVVDPVGAFDTVYTYDDLNQLTSETGHFVNQYAHDSLNNRRSKDNNLNIINDLNQVTQDQNNQYTYDPNGRRLTKQEASYIYDALGRLTFIKGKEEIFYHHDPFGRLMEKRTAELHEKFLYQFDTEIASFNNEQMTAFKALYGTHAPFALELDGEVYSTIRNHRGDLSTLLADIPACTFRYNAFGEFSHEGHVVSPWLFSGQRYDADSGLYHYAKRKYDPALGVWLTPDPFGFADGPNLYAYVKNNPLTFIDPYGLWGEEYDIVSRTAKRTGETYRNATRIANDISEKCRDVHEKYRQVKQTYRDLEEYSEGFARGFADETSFGLSSIAFGEYNPKSSLGREAYTAGTGASIALGCAYGGTELKGAVALAKGSMKALKSGTNAAKGLLKLPTASREVKRVVSNVQTATKTVKKVSKGRHKNFLRPDENAIGSHTVFKIDSQTNRITNYETYKPNPRNPKNPWESTFRFDSFWSDKGHLNRGHFNKVEGKNILEPHVHDPNCPGGLRPAKPNEIPNY